MTLTAEHQRVKEELESVLEELNESKQENRRIERDLDDKSSEVLKLKKYQLELQTNYEA